jgi:hypothetical protein
MSDHKVVSKPGFVQGRAVVRDKDGNVKGEFTFEGPATPEQVEQLKQEVSSDGSHSDDSSTQRSG